MHQFEVSDDGRVRESSVRAAVSRLMKLFPQIDGPSVEAQLMLGRTHGALVDMRGPYWARFGITGPRFMVLRLLYLADDQQASMGEIATDLNKGMANVTQLIDGLVQDGLVERGVAPDDRRVVHARLTARGGEFFAAVFPQNAARIKQAWAPLSDEEKDVLIHLLARVRMHLLASRDSEMLLEELVAGRRSERAPSRPESGRNARRRRPAIASTEPEVE